MRTGVPSLEALGKDLVESSTSPKHSTFYVLTTYEREPTSQTEEPLDFARDVETMLSSSRLQKLVTDTTYTLDKNGGCVRIERALSHLIFRERKGKLKNHTYSY